MLLAVSRDVSKAPEIVSRTVSQISGFQRLLVRVGFKE